MSYAAPHLFGPWRDASFSRASELLDHHPPTVTGPATPSHSSPPPLITRTG